MPPKQRASLPEKGGSARRRMLMLRIFPLKFTAQDRVDRCLDAFREMHDGDLLSSGDEMVGRVELFVREVDSILADFQEEKESVATTLSVHPWFARNDQELSYDAEKNSLSLVPRGSGDSSTLGGKRKREDDWDRFASMANSGMGTISKAKAPAPPTTVSKAASLAKAPPPTEAAPPPMDPVLRRFADALMRCLPQDNRPWDASGSVQNILTACYDARGSQWPKLDLVGGGTGGNASIADLHELSVALLSRVKEKAMAEAGEVEEGSDLTTMFVKENQIGDEAEAALRALPVTAGLRVIGAGAVTGMDAPAVVMARIRRAGQAVKDAQDVNGFIEENWVSTEAERSLRFNTAEVQKQVLSEGPLLGQAPSNELLERIDKAQAKAIRLASAEASQEATAE